MAYSNVIAERFSEEKRTHKYGINHNSRLICINIFFPFSVTKSDIKSKLNLQITNHAEIAVSSRNTKAHVNGFSIPIAFKFLIITYARYGCKVGLDWVLNSIARSAAGDLPNL